MNFDLDIPKALKPNFQRVYRRIPPELRQHSEFIEDLILFLKVGGERLARQRLEVAKNDLKLFKTAKRKERRRETMRRTALAAAESAEASEHDPMDDENNGVDDDTDVSLDDDIQAQAKED
jgi:hypothetical protein